MSSTRETKWSSFLEKLAEECENPNTSNSYGRGRGFGIRETIKDADIEIARLREENIRLHDEIGALNQKIATAPIIAQHEKDISEIKRVADLLSEAIENSDEITRLREENVRLRDELTKPKQDNDTVTLKELALKMAVTHVRWELNQDTLTRIVLRTKMKQLLEEFDTITRS